MGIKTVTGTECIADFKTVEKNAKNLLTKMLKAKKVCKIGVCPLLCYYLLPVL
jgi:hypothetical protein